MHLLKEGKIINIVLETEPEQIFRGVHELVRMAFPEFDIMAAHGHGEDCPLVRFHAQIDSDQIRLYGCIRVDGKVTENRETCRCGDGNALPNEARWIARAFAYRMLCRHCGCSLNDYGLLTGVRPVKLVHRMMDKDMTEPQIMQKLQQSYLISYPKARLLAEVAQNNRPYAASTDRDGFVSIYVGIPLCPSRCFYCSFPGAVVKDYNRQVPPYVHALLQELNGIGDALAKAGLKAESIYIGGGTPTVLNDRDLEAIFEVMQQKYISASTLEITLEAGRPDTLSLPRMKLFKNAGVNRLCINPQTMNDMTLRRIGRHHSRMDIMAAAEWARAAGFARLNMDLIVGLPGETENDYRQTAEQVLALKPENITIHTLAAKKGSDLARMEGANWKNDRPVKEGLKLMQESAAARGYQPYYLYRQKYMRTDAENIGYSLPGYFCRFNIQMMEERQTVIGIGGGAATKFIDSDGKITSIYNPTDPITYSTAVTGLVRRKVDNLGALN
jgi:oxygen-independent coproporphyrinogen-3 oxidase